MGKYIKLFGQHSQYEAYINSSIAVLPNVSFCEDIPEEVHYNPWVRDYSKEYLTFEIVEDGTITIAASDANAAKTISYSTDEGDTWTDLTTSTTEQSLGSFSAGDKIMLKGANTAYAANSSYYNQFGGTAKYVACGNIMSLLYGDNFVGETSFPTGSTYTFYKLFMSSIGLTDASNLMLPATTLKMYCYSSMFSGCTSLTTAPELPATSVTQNCYASMFNNCTSLTSSPELPAVTLQSSCYSCMFSGCTSLTTAPELPATALDRHCYSYMFAGCTSLTTIPSILPATSLYEYCYMEMFSKCTSLTTAPELQAITMGEFSCSSMFSGCTSLTTAPSILPATSLANSCYQYMFAGCTSLTTAPELPAIRLSTSCYNRMFIGCTSLNYIKAMFVTVPGTSYTTSWTQGVPNTGTFVKNTAADWNVTGANGVPTGWAVQTELPTDNYNPTEIFTPQGYVTFTTTDSIAYIGLAKISTHQTMYISNDGSNWHVMAPGKFINFDSGRTYYVCGNLTSGNTTTDYTQFMMLGQISASGNVNSIWSYSSLSRNLLNYCGLNMFARCTSMTLESMLMPASTLVEGCYYYMFQGCTDITTAPNLPAKKLVTKCYSYMFNGCTNLNYIKAMFTTTPSTAYTQNWVSGVASTGTFVKNTSATWTTTGVNGIPTGWTVQTASA